MTLRQKYNGYETCYQYIQYTDYFVPLSYMPLWTEI